MAGGSRKKSGPTPVEALEHGDTRANIPTDELRDFVAADERRPEPVRYDRRDVSLDPQLMWKGKDEQDSDDLVVQALPIYIQEKIEPRAIVEDLRRRSGTDDAPTLFDNFNGLEFEDLVDFYNHGVHWSNRMILGDSLRVMASLAGKENLRGQVQMVYIDPPYGIKFGSNWQVSTRKRDVRDGQDTDLTRQPEQVKAFRDTWEMGIHSYLSYLRDRLVVARDLLTESGSVFVQIGDENVHLVRSLLDEVFGAENFVAEVMFYTTSGRASATLDAVVDRLIWFAKDLSRLKYRELFLRRPERTLREQYVYGDFPQEGKTRRLTSTEVSGIDPLPPATRRFMPGDMSSQGATADGSKPYVFDGREYQLPANTHWKTSNPEGLDRLAVAGRLHPIGKRLRYRRYDRDFPIATFTNVWEDTITSGYADPKVYVVQTGTRVVERCLLMTTDPGDLVLDPTCGSGTTAYVAEQWGRRWITVDTSRVALALARTRLMSARFPYYLLTDSTEGRAKESQITGLASATGPTGNDVKKGFVYKRVPHITLKSIANNPDIREGMTREQIDAAIARHADSELLVDQPYEDNRRIRVTGRFTVESLSPHRVLDTEVERSGAEVQAKADPDQPDYVSIILANLLKAGVQNTVKDERMNFETLEPFAGEWVQARGEFTDKEGAGKRVAVAIGPEHGTVGPTLVREAAKEAVRGIGHDILVVCGFAFDARVAETAQQFGDLTVLPARMNPDLLMDSVLKTTGAGNLFTVFGEPDVTVKVEGDEVTVELRGVDVYDPTTGEIRSNSTDDVACWFIDTDYNRESFFVRHAYFTGADEPYDKLKRALRADIDEDAWATLYVTVSRPFPKPETGRIAIKVINHYGDEVMKVYEVE